MGQSSVCGQCSMLTYAVTYWSGWQGHSWGGMLGAGRCMIKDGLWCAAMVAPPDPHTHSPLSCHQCRTMWRCSGCTETSTPSFTPARQPCTRTCWRWWCRYDSLLPPCLLLSGLVMPACFTSVCFAWHEAQPALRMQPGHFHFSHQSTHSPWHATSSLREARATAPSAAWASCRTCGWRCSGAGTTPCPTPAASRWLGAGIGVLAERQVFGSEGALPCLFLPHTTCENALLCQPPSALRRPWSCSWACASTTAATRRATSPDCRWGRHHSAHSPRCMHCAVLCWLDAPTRLAHLHAT